MIRPNKNYKVFSVRKGEAQSGKYTIIKICDRLKEKNGSFTAEYFSVFVNTDVNVYNNAEISFTLIDGVRKKTNSYNGKQYTEVSLFVSPDNLIVESLGDAPVDENSNSFPQFEDGLPF